MVSADLTGSTLTAAAAAAIGATGLVVTVWGARCVFTLTLVGAELASTAGTTGATATVVTAGRLGTIWHTRAKDTLARRVADLTVATGAAGATAAIGATGLAVTVWAAAQIVTGKRVSPAGICACLRTIIVILTVIPPAGRAAIQGLHLTLLVTPRQDVVSTAPFKGQVPTSTDALTGFTGLTSATVAARAAAPISAADLAIAARAADGLTEPRSITALTIGAGATGATAAIRAAIGAIAARHTRSSDTLICLAGGPQSAVAARAAAAIITAVLIRAIGDAAPWALKRERPARVLPGLSTQVAILGVPATALFTGLSKRLSVLTPVKDLAITAPFIGQLTTGAGRLSALTRVTLLALCTLATAATAAVWTTLSVCA